MKSKAATATFALRKDSPTKSGFPIRVRITHERKSRFFPLKFNDPQGQIPPTDTPESRLIQMATEPEFEMIRAATKGNMKYRQERMLIDMEVAKYEELIRSCDKFTFDRLAPGTGATTGTEKPAVKITGIAQMLEHLASEFDKPGTKSVYLDTARAVRSFMKGKDVPFSEVTPEWLAKFSKSGSWKPTTASIYCRTLRAAYRKAMKKKLFFIAPDKYPFGEDGFICPSALTNPRYLSEHEFYRMAELETEDPQTAWAKDMCIFSAEMAGINLEDILRLKWSNIEGDFLVFYREKTASTKKQREQIRVDITDEARRIIDKYGDRVNTEGYIFPQYIGLTTEAAKFERKKWTNKRINRALRQLAESAGINRKVTFYHFRGTYANLMIGSGASRDIIGQTMGNRSSLDNYIDAMKDDAIRAARRKAFRRE